MKADVRLCFLGNLRQPLVSIFDLLESRIDLLTTYAIEHVLWLVKNRMTTLQRRNPFRDPDERAKSRVEVMESTIAVARDSTLTIGTDSLIVLGTRKVFSRSTQHDLTNYRRLATSTD